MVSANQFLSTTDFYFDKTTSPWNYGAFCKACYTLPDFPTDPQLRKRLVPEIWAAQLARQAHASEQKKALAAPHLAVCILPSLDFLFFFFFLPLLLRLYPVTACRKKKKKRLHCVLFSFQLKPRVCICLCFDMRSKLRAWMYGTILSLCSNLPTHVRTKVYPTTACSKEKEKNHIAYFFYLFWSKPHVCGLLFLSGDPNQGVDARFDPVIAPGSLQSTHTREDQSIPNEKKRIIHCVFFFSNRSYLLFCFVFFVRRSKPRGGCTD